MLAQAMSSTKVGGPEQHEQPGTVVADQLLHQAAPP